VDRNSTCRRVYRWQGVRCGYHTGNVTAIWSRADRQRLPTLHVGFGREALCRLRRDKRRPGTVLPELRESTRRAHPRSRRDAKSRHVVFADVTGSTALGELLDPETLRRVMSRYFDEMSGVIERHGGAVEKFIGDAVMAVFGIPRLHEDDALRAVRAARDMGDALGELNAELEKDHGVGWRSASA
jgi:class 3 adenylate cyclase